MPRLINFNLFTVQNVIAIGAIIFFWGAVTYFLREVVTLDSATGAPADNQQ